MGSFSAPKTVSVSMIEGSANALATNKDATQIVVAGRNVFKIFSLDDELEIVEKLNLRVGKNLNLNFSCADVVWNPVEDNILATAATNGAVVTWNLNKVSRSKQDMVFQHHKRTVNKVSFHPTEPHLLISGSQDGTMKMFDLRRKEVTSTFYSNSESVRDVQFSPHQYFLFVAVQENGNVQVWDLRRADRYEKQFTGHNGPVFACDWHPEERRWIATAGRDKTIKVWDVAGRAILDHTIQTIASVARIRWRPQRKYHIASSSLVVDFSVNIWDIRRPYIPFAAFNEHKDVTTGIAWRHDPHTFFSTSKDCTVCHHVFKDAVRPADSANPVGLDVNSCGDISFAASNKLLVECSVGKGYYSSTRFPAALFSKPPPSLSDQFHTAISSFFVFQNNFEKNMSMKGFVESAKRYQLTGKCLGDMCDHNSAVAMELERYLVAQTWQMIKVLYSSVNLQTTDAARLPAVVEGYRAVDAERDVPHGSESANNDNAKSSRLISGGNHRQLGGNHGERQLGDITTTGFSEDDSENEDPDHERTLTTIASGLANSHGDFLFGDGEVDQITAYGYDESLQAVLELEDWTLPNEAFQPRHEILTHSPPLEQLCIATISPGDFSESHVANGKLPGMFLETESHTPLTANPEMLSLPSWDFSQVVVDMLRYYAVQGDVQMAVSVMIVLGDRIKGNIEEQTQEQWFTSYLDLLSRFELWTIANEIIKLSPLSNVNMLNQQSTTIHTNCSNCGRTLLRVGWLCDRCKSLTNICSVCHLVVKGLYVWCQGCSHGGHLQHMQEWLAKNPWCPTGCGHKCEYT